MQCLLFQLRADGNLNKASLTSVILCSIWIEGSSGDVVILYVATFLLHISVKIRNHELFSK